MIDAGSVLGRGACWCGGWACGGGDSDGEGCGGGDGAWRGVCDGERRRGVGGLMSQMVVMVTGDSTHFVDQEGLDRFLELVAQRVEHHQPIHDPDAPGLVGLGRSARILRNLIVRRDMTDMYIYAR